MLLFWSIFPYFSVTSVYFFSIRLLMLFFCLILFVFYALGAKEKEHHACASIPEAKPSHSSEKLNPEEEHQHAVNEKLPE